MLETETRWTFGMNGIIVTVIMKITAEPRAPRIPNLLFQNPANKSAPNDHAETPKKPTGPSNAEDRIDIKISGLLNE